MEETALFDLLPVVLEERQFFESLHEECEESVGAGGWEVLLEETTDVEALLIEDKVNDS